MKTHRDPRHLHRIEVMQSLFAYDFSSENKIDDEEVLAVIKNQTEIDEQISKAAPAWPVAKINKTDLAILRLGVYELMFKKDAPIKVIVDEAVEIAKEYGSDSSPSFINGVLGKVIEENKIS